MANPSGKSEWQIQVANPSGKSKWQIRPTGSLKKLIFYALFIPALVMNTIMQNFALFDAYAECAARLEGHLYGLKNMNVLTDRNVVVYLIKNFTKLEPSIKMIHANDGKRYSNMYHIKNVTYLMERMEGRMLAISEGNETEIQFDFEKFSSGRVVLHNGQPAFKTVCNDMAYGFDGQILGEYKTSVCGQFDTQESVIEYKKVRYALKHDRRQYDGCQDMAGYIYTLYRINNIDVCAIYNPFELNERIKNQPMVEFWSRGMPDVISGPLIYTASGLMYVVTNNITMIDIKARCVIWHFSHEKNHMPWIQAPWEYPEHVQIKPNGNLLVFSGGDVYEIQV